ncbi:MAG: diguanylate cyclase [Colwellia sp.]
MNNKTVVEGQLKSLQIKLDTAINSRATLEEDFKSQSTLLIQFISKLSNVSKGIDIQLDNRLAQLRTLFTKSAPISDIEEKITVISKLLQQHSVTNENNIQLMHDEFHNAGSNLQKIKGLPDDLRRNLRALLQESKSSKDAIIQYVPLLSQLLEFYEYALKVKANTQNGGLLGAASAIPKMKEVQTKIEDVNTINANLIEKIYICLNALNLSEPHTKKLSLIQKKLLANTSNDEFLTYFIEIFDVIAADLQNERNSAQNFLSTLSKTLTIVQNAVKKTLSTCQESQETNAIINQKLQTQLVDMTTTVETALSLDQVKVDINEKLQIIANTLEEKSAFERKSQQALADQLTEMATRVKQLEVQSEVFEKKLAEQRRKSMQDSLTKLSNRAAFDEFFAKSIVRFHHKPFELALVVIDIDDFKQINDTYGHTAGDKTLQVIANTIQKRVTKDAFVARYGGEEFVIVYSNINQAHLIKELDSINSYIARLPFKFKNNKVSITLSLGASHIRSDDNIHTAFERADQAMYMAKSQGKNQVIYTK